MKRKIISQLIVLNKRGEVKAWIKTTFRISVRSFLKIRKTQLIFNL